MAEDILAALWSHISHFGNTVDCANAELQWLTFILTECYVNDGWIRESSLSTASGDRQRALRPYDLCERIYELNDVGGENIAFVISEIVVDCKTRLQGELGTTSAHLSEWVKKNKQNENTTCCVVSKWLGPILIYWDCEDMIDACNTYFVSDVGAIKSLLHVFRRWL